MSNSLYDNFSGVDAPGLANASTEEICKYWDGKKVWAVVDDMWRQATVLSCGPSPESNQQWIFVLQSKHDSCRYVVICNSINNGLEFDNLEMSEHVEIPVTSVDNVKLSYESLPKDSPNVALGSYQCPIHPYVAEYIKRLLFQLELQTGDGHVSALVSADSENSRLRLALETANAAYASLQHNYDKYVSDLLLEIDHLNEHNRALAQAAVGNSSSGDFQMIINRLNAENKRLVVDNLELRNSNESLKNVQAPAFSELEKLQNELAQLKASIGGVQAHSQPASASELAALRSLNESLTNDLRAYGKRLSELTLRVISYEGRVIELGRPAFDYNSSSDTTRMFTRIADETTKLQDKLAKLEFSIRIDPRSGMSPFAPLQGSFAEQIVQLHNLLITLQSRIDAIVGSTDRNSLASNKIMELEKDKSDLLKVVAMAENEIKAAHAYLDKTVNPVLAENDQLRVELLAKVEQLRALEAGKAKTGLFW